MFFVILIKLQPTEGNGFQNSLVLQKLKDQGQQSVRVRSNEHSKQQNVVKYELIPRNLTRSMCSLLFGELSQAKLTLMALRGNGQP